MINEATEKVVKKIDLTQAETREVFDEIMSDKAEQEQIIAFLKALKEKGETAEEIAGAALALRKKSLKIKIKGDELVDTCGTGGTGVDTFNISTTAAFVAAGCGLRIAKHGNRSASSRCGSADVLEALGVRIDAGTEFVEKCISEIGIGFLYAPLFHKAMKYAAEPRRKIGTRTIFNVLGPLSNPAGAACQVIGVYDEKLTEVLAHALKELGSRKVLVVHGMDNLDEITITDRTKVTELDEGSIRTYYISPEEFGMKRTSPDTIKGGDAGENARILQSILKGEKGPRRDIVLLNAAAALVAGFKAKDLKQGIKLSAESIDSLRAFDKLQQLIRMAG